MSTLPTLDSDLAIISALSDEPNETDGLSAAALKAKFDQAGLSIKAYINNTLLPELDRALAALAAADATLEALANYEPVSELPAEDGAQTLPSSVAVREALATLHDTVSDEIAEAMGEAGQGDMSRVTYDPDNKGEDIFAYADAIGEALNNLYQDLAAKFDSVTGKLTVANGGTGAGTKAGARAGLGVTSGTTDPSGGDDGDIYVKYV